MDIKPWTLLFTLFFCSVIKADADFDNYASQSDRYLPRKQETQALLSLEKNTARGISGVSSRPGEVVFNYGQGHHAVVCAVLELCDIAMEPGEHIKGAQIGDATRWSVDSAVSGQGENATEHLIIKPYESALKTSLLITTDRRAYHLSLKSSLDEYMPQVRFIYPEGSFGAYNDSRLKLNFGKQNTASANDSEKKTNYQASSQSVRNEEFEITGDEEICPLNVYFDGKRTVITMPSGLHSMPVLSVIADGGFFHEDKEGNVNYRLLGNDYVVDGLLHHAKLKLSSPQELQAEIRFVG